MMMNTKYLCSVLVLVSCFMAAMAYEQSSSPLHLRRLAALRRRRAVLDRSLSAHQARVFEAARTRVRYETSVHKFEKLLSATGSACKSLNRKACIHSDEVRSQLDSLREKLRGARQMERDLLDEGENNKLARELKTVEQRIGVMERMTIGMPSITPMPSLAP